MRRLIRKLLGLLLGREGAARLTNKLFSRQTFKGELSFSQEGEDRLLANLFRGQKVGFYVDIGAHHPYFLSNTQLFYMNGWRGINIDANPDCMTLFRKFRPQDINITAGVGKTPGEMSFHCFEEPALSTFDEKLASERIGLGRKLIKKVKINIEPLSSLLQRNLTTGRQIDFMSVDVEGFDFDVIQSNDWDSFRPKVLLVECLGLDISAPGKNETINYLSGRDYRFFGKLVNTCVFVDQKLRNDYY